MSYQGNTGCSCGGEGNSGGSGGGKTTVVCARPSIPVAVPGMCLANGTPIAVIATRAKDGSWLRTGWLNLATGGFTAGRPPASAKPCDDGQDNGGGGDEGALTGVHVESWCDLDDDGSVLSPVLAKYATDDTGAITDVEFLTPDGEPYEIQGTLGICNIDGPADLTGRELVKLCDTADDGTSITFVRDYERDADGAVTGYTDYDVDGQPYTPTGTVTSCDTAPTDTGDECASPTTPVATTGLCLADGTPIAVTVERDCDGTVSRTGWINLATGTYSEGQYPEGTRACGETSAFDVSGVLCDVDDDGDVLGLVLIEVERGTDGEITGTRLINPADGSVYELQGQLSVCPAGVEQPERDLIELCDLADNGEDVEFARFLRDYTRDENGAITGYTDYTLDGEPYTPAGEVGSCDDVVDESAQRERDLVRLCDTVEGGEGVAVTVFVRDYERDTTGNIVGYLDYTLDGQPYTPAGEIGTCEAASETPTRARDLLRLCDSIDAGEGTEIVVFVRDFERDENGVIVGYADYTLDGQPYDPQGDVGSCGGEDSCHDCETLVLCDTQPGEQQPTEFVSVPLGELPPAGRFGDGSPVSGTLDNGVDYAVNVGEWISPQNHYTFYPSDNPQTWTFSEPVFVRFGLRGLNITPTECYVLPEGVEVESISPAHTWDEASRTLCDSGSSGATDESYFVTTTPVTELPLRASGSSTGGRGPGLIEASLPTDPDTSGELVAFLRTYCRDCDGTTITVTDTELDGTTAYTPTGEVRQCGNTASGDNGGGGGDPTPEIDLSPIVLCDTLDEGEGEQVVSFLRSYRVDNTTGEITGHIDTELDGTTPYEPVGEVGQCGPAAPSPEGECRDTTSTLLCDVAAVDRVTVFDPANVPGSDGWEVVAFDGAADGYGPEEAMPYPAPHPAERSAYMGARTDLWAGPGPKWDSYETAPIRWVLRKTFTAAEDGVAVVESIGFRGDGGARVRVNGTDAGMYGQWNQPATSGTAQIPVTAGPNTIEIEVRDVSGDNWITGRLDVAMPRTTQFLRTQVIDCDTGDIVSTTDTTLDGEPYEVVGEVGQCEPTAQCCEPPAPEARVVVETALRCLLDADGAVLGEVLVERVYDDQSGDLIERRHVDPDTNEPVEIPDGATVGQCVTPCHDTSSTLLCDEGGGAETAVLDVATLPDGPTGGTLSNGVEWTVNAGRVLGNNASYGIFGDGGEPSGPQRWEFDQPVALRVGFSGLNRDDECIQVPSYLEPEQVHASHVWDPAARTLCSVAEVPAEDTSMFVTTMPVSVFEWSNLSPGDAASGVALLEATVTEAPTQFRRTVVMDCETHQVVDVIDTTLDGEPYEVTGEVGQCATAGGGECCPPPEPECPVAFSTECVAVVTRSVVSYDNTSTISGVPGRCGSVQGPEDANNSGASFACQGGPYRITSWIIDGEDVVTGDPKEFSGGPCGPGDDTEPGMHTTWADALTNLDPHGAWLVDTAPGCSWYVHSDEPRSVEYGPMVVEGDGMNTPDGTWVLGPVQSCEETQYTKVYSQDCDGEVTVSWLDAQGDPADAPEGELVPCGTGCRPGGGGGCCDEPSPDVRCREHILCDTGPDGDDPVTFMRTICRDSTGAVVSVTDTELDATTPYTVRT